MRKIAALFAVLSLASSASAASHGILWARGKGPNKGPVRAAAASNLLYYGGPVIPHAKIYAVFWGGNVDANTRQNIGPFFGNIVDSGYMDWLSEYDTNGKAVDGRDGTHQHIGRGSYGGAFTIAPARTSNDLSDADVQAELEAQIAAGHLPPSDENSLYMTFFPAGVNISIEGQKSCSSFCAYHEGFKSKSGAPVYYGVMPVCGGFGCGFGDAFQNLCVAASHEAIEAVTDPFPTPGSNPAFPQAWNTSDGQEIADLCQSSNGSVTGHGLTSTVSGLWDNASSSCLSGPWQQAPALARVPATPMKLGWKSSWTVPAW
jgi:hypothetical protein